LIIDTKLTVAPGMAPFEKSIGLSKEASSLAKNVPYLGIIAGILLEIVKIKGVRLLLFSSILSETQLNRRAISTGSR
jgi:hypothetical protein